MTLFGVFSLFQGGKVLPHCESPLVTIQLLRYLRRGNWHFIGNYLMLVITQLLYLQLLLIIVNSMMFISFFFFGYLPLLFKFVNCFPWFCRSSVSIFVIRIKRHIWKVTILKVIFSGVGKGFTRGEIFFFRLSARSCNCKLYAQDFSLALCSMFTFRGAPLLIEW